MKNRLLALIIFLQTILLHAQSPDSLIRQIQQVKEDTEKVKLMSSLTRQFEEYNPDTAMLLAQEGLSLAERIKYPIGEARLLSDMGNVYQALGNFPKALESQLKSLDVYGRAGETGLTGYVLHNIALLYSDQKESRLALSFFLREKDAIKIDPDKEEQIWNLLDIAKTYEYLGDHDSARYYTDRVLDIAKRYYGNNYSGAYLNSMGQLFYDRGMFDSSFLLFQQSLPVLIQGHYYRQICESYIGLARLFKDAGKTDSAIIMRDNVCRSPIKKVC